MAQQQRVEPYQNTILGHGLQYGAIAPQKNSLPN